MKSRKLLDLKKRLLEGFNNKSSVKIITIDKIPSLEVVMFDYIPNYRDSFGALLFVDKSNKKQCFILNNDLSEHVIHGIRLFLNNDISVDALQTIARSVN